MPARASPRRSGISLTYRIERHEQGHRDRGREGLPRERPAGLDHVGAEQHHRPEAQRDRDLAEPPIDELERRRGVADRHDEPDDADDEQRGRAPGREQHEPDHPGQDVEHRGQSGHLAQRHEAVLDDPRAAAELGRRDVRVVGALDGVEDVVRDVQPELDERGADHGQRRSDQVERAVAGRDQDAQQDRDDRRGQERQAGRAQGQEAERELRLDRRAALRGQRIEVLARLGQRPLRVLEERHLGLVPAPRAAGGQDDRRAPAGVAVPHTVTWRRSS